MWNHGSVHEIIDMERIAAAHWRGTEEERLGGWLLRAAEGFTGRANSDFGYAVDGKIDGPLGPVAAISDPTPNAGAMNSPAASLL